MLRRKPLFHTDAAEGVQAVEKGEGPVEEVGADAAAELGVE